MKGRRITRWSSCGPTISRCRGRGAAPGRELAVIPPLMRQARSNLTGNARDLWVTRHPRHSPGSAGQLAAIEARRRRCERCIRRHDGAAWLPPKNLSHGSRQRRRQDGAVGHRQGQLHLVSAERAPRAADLGGRGAPAEARTGSGLGIAETRGAPQPQPAAAGRGRHARRSTSRRWTPVERIMRFSTSKRS